MTEKRKYLLALFSGLLLALSFPPMVFSGMALFGLVPLLFVLEKEPKRPYLIIYLTFFVYHFGSNWWISSWQPETDPYLLISGLAVAIVHPFLFWFPFILYNYVKRKIGFSKGVWFFPFFWVVFEWLHSLGDLAYPWLNLGYTQASRTSWIQIADVTGVWGISFIIVFINILFLKILVQSKSENGIPVTLKNLFTYKPYYKFFYPFIAIYVLLYIYGAVRISVFDHEDLVKKHKNLRIALVQPAINPWKKWETSATEQIFRQTKLQDSISNKVPNIDLSVWSETAITFVNMEMNADHDFNPLQKWIDYPGISLFSGFADFVFYKKGEKTTVSTKYLFGDQNKPYETYNSAILLNPAKSGDKTPQIYHKMKLTPFGERIPYLNLISFARKWIEWGVGISSWDFGKEQKVLKLNNGKKTATIGPIICIESLYPGFVAGFVNQGADVLALITNDSWYDHTYGPDQHYAIAMLRAIETKRYIARCANTGISGFISPTGQTIQKAEQYKATAIYEDIPLIKDKTIYVLFGDWFVYLCLGVGLSGLIYPYFLPKKQYS